MRTCIGIWLLVTTPSLATAAQAPQASTPWPTATPASQGVNGAVLDSIDSEIKAGRYGNVDRLLVIRRGKAVFNRSYAHDYDKINGDSSRLPAALNARDKTGPFNYYNPWWHPTYQRGTLHTLQSVTKTVTSVIFGVAITRGDLKSIDVPVLSFFDTTKVANIDDRKRRMTVRHLLTMTGGIDWNGSLPNGDPNNTEVGLERSADWIAYTINRPMMRDPGTKFNYSSGEAALLAHVFREATGTDLEEYAAKYLFAPLGIAHWFWKRSSSGSLDTEGGLYLEASDLARIWQLALSRGTWNGTQVVSRAWMDMSVTPAIATNAQPNSTMYGLYWWLYRDPVDPTKFVWGGSGFGGQHPLAFPRLDIIAVVNSWNIGGGPGVPVRALIERLSKAARE